MWIPDRALDHLRAVADQPDLDGTRYRLIELIGRGGMGSVHRVHDTALDRDVALKILHAPGNAHPARDATRLLDEARILARLEHPGIVPVHDVGTLPDGRVYCAMKLVRGKRLDVVAGGTAGLAERLRIFQRICETIAFAHAHGVLHRDLKPQNVMVAAFGEVLVLDWGIAGHTTAACPDPEPAAHRTRMGTPGWMAPEQEHGLAGALTARTDVFGLGAILRYLVETLPDAPDSPSARRQVLLAIAARATAAEPAGRYPDVPSLAGEVERFIEGRAVIAYREPILEMAARLIRKYRTPILLVLTYLAMRVLLILFAGSS